MQSEIYAVLQAIKAGLEWMVDEPSRDLLLAVEHTGEQVQKIEDDIIEMYLMVKDWEL